MAADLRIHIWDKQTLNEEVLRVFFKNNLGHTFGAPLGMGYNVGQSLAADKRIKELYGKDPYNLIAETPSYYVGENSTLKAVLFEDDKFLYGTDKWWKWLKTWDLEEINDELVGTAIQADLSTDFIVFLEQHRGKHVMAVNW